MKKTQKKILGISGLCLVVVITILAAILPVPGASATESVTDTIQVRVVGSVPDVNILGIDNGEVITVPNQSFTVTYENVADVTVTLEHTDLDGNTTTYLLDELTPDYYAGSEEYDVHFVE
ncbi:hypothetical protein IKG60_01580 [Candidatus Saccharibacteria bacterium]|nr:hypothetical protein [Candidatus Saccharibacteria bacterium]